MAWHRYVIVLHPGQVLAWAALQGAGAVLVPVLVLVLLALLVLVLGLTWL